MPVEKLTTYNKFLTTSREKLELARLASRISGAVGASVKPSQIIRACLIQLLYSEEQIIEVAEGWEPIKRPSNAEAEEMAEFDRILAEILSRGFQSAGPMQGSRD